MQLLRLPISDITIPENRQRLGLGEDEKKAQQNFEELKQSISNHGLLNPIRLTKTNELIAGFRRVEAHKALGLTHIFATIDGDKDLDPLQRELQELDENVQRFDLSWQEKQRAIARIDSIRTQFDPNWTQSKTAAVVGTTQGKVSDANMLTRMMDIFPEIAQAKTKKQALSIAKSKAKIHIRKAEVKANPEAYKSIIEKVRLGKAEEIIAQLPAGFCHHHLTDGPFGIDYDKQQAGVEGGHEAYDDSPEAYRTRTAIMAPHLYRTLKDSGFLIWFLGHDHLEWTQEIFRAAGFTVDPIPLLWDRSEGRSFTRRPDRWFGKAYDIALHCIKGNPEMVVRGRSAGNVFRFKPVSSSDKDHIVERPIELYAEIIKCISVEGEKICDWFAGSGAVSAACAILKRDYFATEVNPNHIPTILTNIFNNTPQQDIPQNNISELVEAG